MADLHRDADSHRRAQDDASDATLPDPGAVDRHGPEDAYVGDIIGEAQAQEIIEEYESEGRAQKLSGAWRYIVGALAVGLSLYALYATRATITTQVYRTAFLGAALVLTFLLYPTRRKWAGRITVIDLALAAASVVVSLYPIINLDEFVYRAARPTQLDVIMGTVMIILVLEATRRTVGWILPVLSIMLLFYGKYGYLLPGEYGHKGYDLDRMVGTLYISLEGIFG
ncbi:MAG TPA: hypothetical protein VFL82_00510, partial [Thermomicrobiales bacterium]|nr:hypothetical protein [Thermomicrobiales bacterium]